MYYNKINRFTGNWRPAIHISQSIYV